MKHEKTWRKSTAILILAILLISSCNQFYEASPSVPIPDSTSTASPSSFKPGDPTATPLGSEIIEPNYTMGMEAINEDNYEEALVLLSAAIEANPNLAPPYQYRGLAYWALGDCVSGLADEEKALTIDPNYAAAWARRGLMYSCLGNDEQSLQDYQKALSIDPSLSFVHYNLGVYYRDYGDYEKSLEEYRLSAAIDPNRFEAWSGQAYVLTQLGRFEECITDASNAIESDPERWIAYSNRAYCELSFGDYASAILDYKVFLDHNPTDIDAWNNLGLAQLHFGYNLDAVTSLNTALELDPFYYQVNINRGLAYTNLREYDKALNDFNRVLEFGEIPAAYSGRGTVYYWLERYDEAISDLELATQMMPNRPHSYCFLALTYFEVGRFQDSLNAAETVNQIEPGCGGQQLFDAQAQSYYALGQYEQGIVFINKAFDMSQLYVTGYYYRGIMYEAIGKNQEAIQDLELFQAMSQLSDSYPKEAADTKERLAKLKP